MTSYAIPTASTTLARWRDAEDGAKGDAHAGYLAALDREWVHLASIVTSFRVPVNSNGGW